MSTVPTSEYAFVGYAAFRQIENHRYLWPAVLKELSGSVSRSARVLDAGCGNGGFCDRMQREFGADVSGFDLSESGIALAQENAPQCRFERLSVYDNFPERFGAPFDVIVSMEVVEHLYDPEVFLLRVREAISPNGVFVLTTPYHGYVKNLLIAASGRCDRHYNPLNKGGHIKFWSRRTIAQLLESAGFRVERIHCIGRLPLLGKSMIVVARPK